MNSIANINFRRKHLRFITPSVPFAERRIIEMRRITALLLAGLYTLFGDTVLPTVTQRVEDMFNYAG